MYGCIGEFREGLMEAGEIILIILVPMIGKDLDIDMNTMI